MLINKYIFILVVQLAIHAIANCQIGYNKHIPDFDSSTINLDDILFSNDELVIRGNIYIDSLDLWGVFIAGLDTTGALLWHNIVVDSTSHLLAGSPSRFIRMENGNYPIGIHYYDTRKLGIIIFDSLGQVIAKKQYDYEGFVAFPQTISAFDGYLYLIGTIQKYDYSTDLYVLKTDDEGNFIWFKLLGSIQNDEFMLGKVLNNNDGTFTISSGIFSPNYQLNVAAGWRKPWIFNIDTSGTIISQWIGDKNDPRTHGGGSTLHLDNGDWIILSIEYKEDENHWNTLLWGPTITKLDKDYNLLWKKYLTEYNFPMESTKDLEFDPKNREFIICGQRIIIFTEDDNTGAQEGWLLKLSYEGEVIWSRTDTLIRKLNKSVEHTLVGVELSSTGSIYAAGTVSIVSFQRGWIIKVTNDGCIDTLCTTTSLEHQMKNNMGLLAYPNPTNNQINIELENKSFLFNKVELFNAEGKLMRLFNKADVFNEESGKINLSVENLPIGVYFTKISYSNGVYSFVKFVKM